MIGCYGALAAAKYHERADYHLHQVRALTRVLVDAGVLADHDALQARAAEMHAKGRPGDRPDTIATLWDLSLEKITQEDLAAVQLLDICAYLAPRPVPLDLFTGHPDRLPEPLTAKAADRLAFTDTVAVIVDYSLAKRTPAGLQLHRLVPAAILSRLAAAGKGR